MAEVLPAHSPDGQSYFSASPLRRSSKSQSFLVGSSSYGSSRKSSMSVGHLDLVSGSRSSSAPSSPVQSYFDLSGSSSNEHSLRSESSSSLSLGTDFDDNSEEDDDTITFPSYRSALKKPRPVDDDVDDPLPSPKTQSPSDLQNSPDPLPVLDDTVLRAEPSHHVDYLSYDWREEDIWSSWRHIVSRRKVYGERSRLENASWRTWAKTKNGLKTVSPETLNWLKDHDVTWLYGPLQPASNRSYSQHTSESASHLSKNNSFLNKKPILKKRSASEVMLQKSISTSSLVKQAAAAVQAQQENRTTSRLRTRPIVGRAASDFVTSSIPSRTISRDTDYTFSSHTTSGLQTPEGGEKRHIRFDDKVEQCIAVDVKDTDEEGDEMDWAPQDDSSDDEGVVMMKSSKRKQLSRTNSRTSFSGESRTIAKLPSTTLKYRTDSPDIPEQPVPYSSGFFRSSKLSPSPSQETLRPTNPAANFLLPNDEDDQADPIGLSWEPSGAFFDENDNLEPSADEAELQPEQSNPTASGLRRTASGMFMPYDGDDDDELAPPGILGRVVDTVNTARDIAHVIWNVGWRK